MLQDLYNKGVEYIRQNDRELQYRFLSTLSEYRYMDVDYLLDLGCFFVHNKQYLIDSFGLECVGSHNDFFDNDGVCKYLGTMMIPIRDLQGDVVGFNSFNPFAKLKEQEDDYSEVKYNISSKKVFNRNRFPLIPNGYEKMFKDGYVIIMDGTFDALTLGSLGLNTFCNLGTVFSEYSTFILSFVGRRYLAMDNDRAGLTLFKSINKSIKCYRLSQNKFKDIDSYVEHCEDKERVRDLILNYSKSNLACDIVLP